MPLESQPAYERIGLGYAGQRRPDPRIAAQIHGALVGMRSVLNVGAGAGSYEPAHLEVLAIEPATRMIAQRPSDAAPVLLGSAEALPLADDSYDASMALLTIHHWRDLTGGLAEMRRVSRHRVIVFTWDPRATQGFWLTDDYFPEFVEEDNQRFPTLERLADLLGGDVEVSPVEIPWNMTDGFLGAYWRRPRAYLDPTVRRGISSFAARSPVELSSGLERLQDDLDSGAWSKKHGACLSHDSMALGYQLLVARLPSGRSAD